MITIRKAVPEDADTITDFQKKMAMETEGIALSHETVTGGVKAVFTDASRGQYWVTIAEEEIIASLLITPEWSDWRDSYVWWFQSVYVLPRYRREGVFKSMYSHVRKEAEKQGIAGPRLYVEKHNSVARLTYEALGMNSEHYAMYEWMKQ